MARAQGVTCDVCQQFEVAPSGTPPAWIKVILPKTQYDVGEDNDRDVCSNRCLERLGKLRRQAESGPTERKPSGEPSSLTPELVEFLDAHGVESRKRGVAISAHKRHHETVNPDCLVCDFETQEQARAV